MSCCHWSWDPILLDNAGRYTRGCSELWRPWLFSLVAPAGSWLGAVLLACWLGLGLGLLIFEMI